MDLDTSKCLSWHEFAQAKQLPSVGGEDGDLGGHVLLAQEVLAELHHKASLMLILVAFAFLDFLFRKVVFYKEKVGRDPLKRKRCDKLEGSLTAGFFFLSSHALATDSIPKRDLERLSGYSVPQSLILVSHHVLFWGHLQLKNLCRF